MVIILTCCLLTAAYGLLMIVYRIGWSKQPLWVSPAAFQPRTAISVIIPARNESAHIEACVRSVLSQNYPPELLEVIVVDDHSDDDTAAIAGACGAQVVLLKDFVKGGDDVNAYKKMALTAGIAASSGQLIVTTDADCVAGQEWLKNVAALYENCGAAMIIGPVSFTRTSTIVGVFQALDFMTMQGITVAARRLGLGNMANGANLAFSRQAFMAVNGYSGIDHLASGDDYLLLFKMQKEFPQDIHYLKCEEAIVQTQPQPDWASFFAQRVRWASKSGKYPDHRLTAILLFVYVFNVAMLSLAIAGLWWPAFWLVLAGMLVAKTSAELYFLMPVAHFFRSRTGLGAFPLLQPLHVFYIVVAGFLGMAGNYRWKGRLVR